MTSDERLDALEAELRRLAQMVATCLEVMSRLMQSHQERIKTSELEIAAAKFARDLSQRES